MKMAIGSGSIDAVRALLDAGVGVNEVTSKGAQCLDLTILTILTIEDSDDCDRLRSFGLVAAL